VAFSLAEPKKPPKLTMPMAANIPKIATTINNSTNVKPFFCLK